MRARGAKVTDIVVLVVAADDGVMPQTVEAINHAKAAKVPIIVAINKIDKPDAKPERVRTELLQHEIAGRIARRRRARRRGLGDQEDSISTSCSRPSRCRPKSSTSRPIRTAPAEGTVIEAKLDRGRGPVATVLVQRGTLHAGDIVVAGAEWGRVRALVSDTGAADQRGRARRCRSRCSASTARRKRATALAVVDSEARAREVTDYRARQKREQWRPRARPACAARSSR